MRATSRRPGSSLHSRFHEHFAGANSSPTAALQTRGFSDRRYAFTTDRWNSVVPADDDWRVEERDLVHQPCIEQRSEDLATAFHQHARDVPLSQRLQRRPQVNTPCLLDRKSVV